VPILPGVRHKRVKPPNPREVALRTLLGGGTQAELDRALRENDLSARDRALLTQLVYGALKMQRSLDWSLSRVVKKPLADLAPALLWALRLGVYQLEYLDKIPAHSAVDESVKLARRFGHVGTASVANAVLRKIAASLLRPPRPSANDGVAAFADYVSLPDWIAEHFIARFGFEGALQAAQGANQMPRRAARVNPRVASVEDTIEALSRVGVTVQRSRYGIPECLVLESVPPIAAPVVQRMIGSGRLTMQSEESQLAVYLLSVSRGEIVLDVCAGRGIKTGALALHSPSKVFAVDDDVQKIAVLQQDMVRLGEERVEAIIADATQPYLVDPPEGVDAVLVDAPCSGIGTIGRRPDLRWVKKPDDGERLARTQRAILEQAARHAKMGGRMLYVTCSTQAREDELVVKDFLSAHAAWRAQPLQLTAPEGSFLHVGEFILTIPGIEGADGFFYALLARTQR
jgi:16S rRNA (cytosine967-C5)-methyltransferase